MVCVICYRGTNLVGLGALKTTCHQFSGLCCLILGSVDQPGENTSRALDQIHLASVYPEGQEDVAIT